jgi:hypothetical protein
MTQWNQEQLRRKLAEEARDQIQSAGAVAAVGGVGGQSYIGGLDKMATLAESVPDQYGARAAIRELMEWHAGESERLSVLLKSLPGILPPAADRALSDLVFRAKGRK